MYFNKNRIYIDAELYYTVSRRGKRIIFAPCKELKKLQRYFLNAIRWKYSLNLNTLEAAKVHAGKKWVLKMDIKDFYNSVSPSRIFNFIKKVCNSIDNANIIYYYNLVTLYDKLPTGAPTSPHIANACFSEIEKSIKNVCKMYGVEFSKYMDDLTFSSDSKEILQKVEKRVLSIVKLGGYEINEKKTKYISDNKRQEILGVVVNNGTPRLSNELKRNIRSMLYNYAKLKTLSPQVEQKDCVNENQIRGYISYAKSIDIAFYNRMKKYSQKLSRRMAIEPIPFFKK